MVEQRSPKPSVACSTRVSPAKSKHFVLAFCFQKKRVVGESESPRKAFVAKCSPADAPLVALRSRYSVAKLLTPHVSLPKASTLCLLFVFKKKGKRKLLRFYLSDKSMDILYIFRFYA